MKNVTNPVALSNDVLASVFIGVFGKLCACYGFFILEVRSLRSGLLKYVKYVST